MVAATDSKPVVSTCRFESDHRYMIEDILSKALRKQSNGVFQSFEVERQFAWELYCSLCNQVWIAEEYDEKEFKWNGDKFQKYLSYSWRGAGGLMAHCAEGRDDDMAYRSFYCCRNEGGVGEGMVTERAKEFWKSMGYKLYVDYYKNNE
jgi:hypothetical protein